MPDNEIETLKAQVAALQTAMGHVALAADNNPWVVTHEVVLEGIDEAWADNDTARQVLHDIVQTVSILNTKVFNLFTGTGTFDRYATQQFRDLLAKQRAVVVSEGEGSKAIAQLADAVRDEIHRNYEKYLSDPTEESVRRLDSAVAELFRPG